MQPFADFISYLENSSIADNIRENDLLFPVINWCMCSPSA